MANYVYVAASLDGYIATCDGGVEWLHEIPNPENSDYGWSEFISGIDAIVLGRTTFEQVLTFGAWPYDRPVFVLSTTLGQVPNEVAEKAEIARDDPLSLIHRLRARGYENLYVDGGKVIQSFLRHDLIDQLIITRIPVVLGDGIPLFGQLGERLRFNHVRTEILNGELVKSHYARAQYFPSRSRPGGTSPSYG